MFRWLNRLDSALPDPLFGLGALLRRPRRQRLRLAGMGMDVWLALVFLGLVAARRCATSRQKRHSCCATTR